MMQEMGFRQIKSAPCSPAKPLGISRTRSESFHVTHKVPVGDSPYVRAKNVQLVEKDPEKAIPLFWAAINAGDRVDSALKDMAIVMKQQNRTEEAIEAIKSLRVRCSDQSQESLDNILLDLFKKCGRLDDQIALLKHKLFLIHQGMAFNGRRTKTARSQGKKFQVSVQQEATRLLGNLGWALMQQSNYVEAEEAYRRALMIAPDNNKMCNLGICLMKQGRINEAKDTLRRVRPAVTHGPRGMDSHLKAYDRAQQMLKDLECEMMLRGGCDRVEQRRLFDSLFSASSVWQPQPCKEQSSKNLPSFASSSRAEDGFPDENIYSANIMVINQVTKHLPRVPPSKVEDGFPDENIDSTNIMLKNKAILEGLKGKKPMNALNVAAPPFYLENSANETLKRTRSGNVANEMRVVNSNKIGESSKTVAEEPEVKTRRRSTSPERKAELWDGLLPDSKDFEEAIIAAALDGSGNEAAEKMGGNGINKVPGMVLKKVVAKKRLQVFRDITLSLSPKA